MTRKTPPKDSLPAGLAPEVLRPACDPAALGFATTEDLKPLDGLIGQERALDAIRLSTGIARTDFNVFVLGPEGSGRHRAVDRILSERRVTRTDGSDWVYVNNFEAPHKPKALRLPRGAAEKLKEAMQTLVDDLANDIPALFESEEYRTERRALEDEFGERHEAGLADFAERAKAEDVAVIRTPLGLAVTAIINGHAVKSEDYQKLPPDEREKIDEKIGRLREDLAEVLRKAPQLEKEHRQRLEELHAGMAERVVSARFKDVRAEFGAVEAVGVYLDAVHKDIIDNAELFLGVGDGDNDGPFPEAIRKFHQEPQFDRYAVNVMVSRDVSPETLAPIVHEDLPTLGNLTGRIEHVSQMGTLVTNFTLIKPGGLHAANGGYLVLDARNILTEPFAWDGLKRCILAKEIKITSMSDRLSLVSTVSLDPDPIPLDVRVVLIGDRRLYALLVMLDPDFSRLFKIQADFEDEVTRSDETVGLFARMLADTARDSGLLPLTAAGIARVMDDAARRAENARKLSLHLDALADVMREADHYSREDGKPAIGAEEVNRAIVEAERRASRIRDRLREAVARQTILIDTKGDAVGQINGLSVLSLGNYRFGHPSRITSRVRMGEGEVVDIEREVELGGPLHSKGVLILSGYLAAKYARDVPMSLHASIVFEQSYGGVEGDSASSAELYSLLSAISGVPIRQGLAVTGSVNQAGRIQAIGGVNEKIEGFFETCVEQGLDGTQGVLIPDANVDHLMLREDVVDAIREGAFRVIPVSTVDEGIAILCGRPAGERGADGMFPEGTINYLVEAQLRQFAEDRRRFTSPGDLGAGEDKNGK